MDSGIVMGICLILLVIGSCIEFVRRRKRINSLGNWEILKGVFIRHQRACNHFDEKGIDHELSNVSFHDNYLIITTKSGQDIQVTANYININGDNISIPSIENIIWMSTENDANANGKLKEVSYDCINFRYHFRRIKLEGLGQSVFPLMKYLMWIENRKG